MTALPVPDQILSGPVVRIASFVTGFSVEATRPSAADIAALAVLERGTRIYLSAVPNRAAEEFDRRFCSSPGRRARAGAARGRAQFHDRARTGCVSDAA